MDNEKEVRQGSQNEPKKGSLSQPRLPKKLTPILKEILFLLTKDYMTIKQIAILRSCSVRCIQKHVKKLKELGLLNPVLEEVRPKVRKSDPTLTQNELFHQIRLHGEHYVIQLLWCDYRYKKLTEKNKLMFLDGHSIKLHRNNIEIYAAEGFSFLGETPSTANSKAVKYWHRFFIKLENKINVLLIKPGSANIERVMAHYAETGNELAKKFNEEHRKIRVVGQDGKVWLTFDDSFSLNEAECVHGQRSHQDMENTVQTTFNDIRDNPHFKLSQLSQFMTDTNYQLNQLTHAVTANAEALGAVLNLVKAQLPKDKELTPEQKPQTFKEAPNYVR